MRAAGTALGYGTPAALQELVAGSPSFDLGYPKIPGRNLEGIPNANDPLMRDKLRQRLLRNPQGSEDLPGFLKQAQAPGVGAIAMDLMEGGPRDGDYSRMPVIPDAAGEALEREFQLDEYRRRAFPGAIEQAPLIYS